MPVVCGVTFSYPSTREPPVVSSSLTPELCRSRFLRLATTQIITTRARIIAPPAAIPAIAPGVTPTSLLASSSEFDVWPGSLQSEQVVPGAVPVLVSGIDVVDDGGASEKTTVCFVMVTIDEFGIVCVIPESVFVSLGDGEALVVSLGSSGSGVSVFGEPLFEEPLFDEVDDSTGRFSLSSRFSGPRGQSGSKHGSVEQHPSNLSPPQA